MVLLFQNPALCLPGAKHSWAVSAHFSGSAFSSFPRAAVGLVGGRVRCCTEVALMGFGSAEEQPLTPCQMFSFCFTWFGSIVNPRGGSSLKRLSERGVCVWGESGCPFSPVSPLGLC